MSTLWQQVIQNRGRKCYSQTMDVTQRGQLTDADKIRLLAVQADVTEARERLQEVAVEMVEKSSYREVARLTGFSTNTLQRWVREAK